MSFSMQEDQDKILRVRVMFKMLLLHIHALFNIRKCYMKDIKIHNFVFCT